MKLKILVVVFAAAVAWFAGRQFYGTGRAAGVSSPSPASAEEARAGEQVFNEMYRLNPGARVEVTGISGPVEVATADGDTAEVHIVNHVSDLRFLENHKISVECSGDRLAVHAANRRAWGPFAWLFGGGGNATQHVTLRLPRRVELRASGISGSVQIAELDGPVKVSGVNGRVEIARVAERADVSGVNGSVSLGLANLGDDGARVSGVNGRVELRLASGANAEVRAGGVNGGVDTSGLSNVTVEDEGRSKFVARVGAGGPLIKLGGINGGIVIRNN